MRLNILAFAAGVIVLQMQPELPPAWPWALAGLLLALPAIRWRGAWPARVVGVVACLALGFAWAAWRADVRLADALPAAWEGRDIEVVGVVAALPQDFSQGSRFEFAVEKVLTATAVVPERIMLSWYQGQRDGEEFVRQPLRPGERWQIDGAPEAAARQRQPARLRLRGLAARTQHPGDRLRAPESAAAPG